MDGSLSDTDKFGVTCTGGGSGGPIPEPPGWSPASRLDVDALNRSSGMLNNC